MTSPTPTLRCLSCGYDVASLIAQRGRDEPGVCPECGTDLAEALRPRPGHSVQKRFTPQTYANFLVHALVRPRALCQRLRLTHSGSGLYMLGNLILGSLIAAPSIGIGVAVTESGPLDQRVLAGLSTGGGAAFILLMVGLSLIVPLMVVLFIVAKVADWRFRGEGRWLALDVGSAWWVTTGPCFLLGALLATLDTVATGALGAALFLAPFVGIFGATFRAMRFLKG
jgi:hypothetical protein